jgi:hypothetical protein
MDKCVKILIMLIAVIGLLASSINAYDIPSRKIEVKPYLNFVFPNNIWEGANQANPVDNKVAPGIGLKLRTQFSRQYGFVLNASYINFQVEENVSSDGSIFTAGGYLSKSFGFGNMTLDLSYGIIAANKEVAGLLMPSLEYSRPISERISLALEFGWPIPNDWPQDFDFKENYSSFTLSLGSIIVF